MHMAHPWCSLKNGKNLSKSTYHFVLLRTNLSGNNAWVGQDVSQILQFWKMRPISWSVGASSGSGQSIKTPDKRKLDPNSWVTMEPFLANSPNPTAMAGGIRVYFPDIGSVNGAASQTISRNQFYTNFAPKAARLYWRITSSPASEFGASLMAS